MIEGDFLSARRGGLVGYDAALTRLRSWVQFPFLVILPRKLIFCVNTFVSSCLFVRLVHLVLLVGNLFVCMYVCMYVFLFAVAIFHIGDGQAWAMSIQNMY